MRAGRVVEPERKRDDDEALGLRQEEELDVEGEAIDAGTAEQVARHVGPERLDAALRVPFDPEHESANEDGEGAVTGLAQVPAPRADARAWVPSVADGHVGPRLHRVDEGQ